MHHYIKTNIAILILKEILFPLDESENKMDQFYWKL